MNPEISRSSQALSLVCVALLFAGGCHTPNFTASRKEQAESFTQKLKTDTETTLKDRGPLDLDACIDIALQNNVALKSAEVQTRLAKLERRTAFSNFLPSLDMKYNITALDRQPASKMFGGFEIPVQDQTVRETTFQLQMPVFVPATWYMYAMREHGEDISNLVTGYVRQQIAVRVTALYFHCLALRESSAAIKSQVTAAETLAKQAQSYLTEGVATASQTRQAELLLEMRKTTLAETDRAQDTAVADLLSTMGLSPLSGLSLVATLPLTPPEKPLEDLVMEALLANPELQIADRNVEIQKDAARIAITKFLPQLFGFANRTSTSNSFQAFPDLGATGLVGVMSLFRGFATINEYKAARVKETQAFLKREETCFTVMTGVIRAYLNWQDAQGTLALTRKALEAADTRATEMDHQWKEGVLNTSDRLEAAAERDRAQGNVNCAQFQEQVALASLRLVLGGAYLGTAQPAATEEPKHEKK